MCVMVVDCQRFFPIGAVRAVVVMVVVPVDVDVIVVMVMMVVVLSDFTTPSEKVNEWIASVAH